MSSNKTVENDETVEDFINAIDNEQKRKDSWEMIALMREITGAEPRMWGSSMVGFGQYHYKYASGREGDSFITGFSPRKTALTVYVMPGFGDYAGQMAKLGPHRTGKSCLYLRSLNAIDREVLEEIIQDSVNVMRKRYVCK